MDYSKLSAIAKAFNIYWEENKEMVSVQILANMEANNALYNRLKEKHNGRYSTSVTARP